LYPEIADAYWLGTPNSSGTLTVGGEQSMTMTGDGGASSGYSLLPALADKKLAGASKKFYMETRVKFTIASGGTVPANGWFIGFSDAAEALTTGAADAIDGVTDAIGFGHVDTGTAVNFYSRDASVSQTISLGNDLTSGIYAKLACYYDGAGFHLYWNDNFISSTAKTQLNVDTGMATQVMFEAVEAKANTLDFQYLLFAVEL